MTAQTPVTVLDKLLEALDRCGHYKAGSDLAPLALLWPDGGRQWERAMPAIRATLAERNQPVLTLGEFDAEAATGPAIWIRSELPSLADGPIPIVYLPGVAKEALRDVEHVDGPLHTLVYLQYRGNLFVQPNGKDWTVPAFLQNAAQGLGLKVDTSEVTRTALVDAVARVLHRPISELEARPHDIDAGYVQQLVTPDLPRQILEWISDVERMRRALDETEWAFFLGQLKQSYHVDAEQDGPVGAALQLGNAKAGSPWNAIWDRFAQAPSAYPGVPEMLRHAKPPEPPQRSLFETTPPNLRWPQVNEAEEDSLRTSLAELRTLQPTEAVAQRIALLEQRHGPRRSSVWHALGQTPLANALASLAELARLAELRCPANDATKIQDYYTTTGWRIDAAALDAMRAAQGQSNRAAVDSALVALYQPWLWETAERYQAAVSALPSPPTPASLNPAPGTCVLFADGLRYDLAARLAESLEGLRYGAELSVETGPIPGITSSAKPAQSPVADLLTGGSKFDVNVVSTGSTHTAATMRKLMTDRGWLVLSANEGGLPDANALGWTELGHIDSFGHNHPEELPNQAVTEVERIGQRIRDLLAAGWRQVKVITDHGWLLTPGPMPKSELPQHHTEIRKGRCARLKPGTVSELQTMPWYWNPAVDVAMAPGISCFEEGKTYEHGGLSPQESLVPVLVVRAASAPSAPVTIHSVTWQGLRCRIEIEGGSPGLTVDLRQKLNDPASSIAGSIQEVGADGRASLVVPDDSFESASAMVVALQDGAPVAHYPVMVGEN